MIDSSFGIKHKVSTFKNELSASYPTMILEDVVQVSPILEDMVQIIVNTKSRTMVFQLLIKQLQLCHESINCVYVCACTLFPILSTFKDVMSQIRRFTLKHMRTPNTKLLWSEVLIEWIHAKKKKITCTPGNESISHHIPPWEKEVHFQKCQMRGDMLYT